MKCQNCGKNEATFYYKSNINGRVMESHLCPQCARQLGLVQDMRRPMISSFWDDDDFFTRPAAEEPREDNLVQGDEREKLSRQRQRNALETQLRHAVETENFEEAAKLRDQLRSLPQA